ncbi:MAG: polysaccharide biosynthesis protein [Clostridia bacterium]|nr:polysaccharide biosynthesis protein [Clostridia bacterium]
MGGHLSELMKLEPLFENYEYTIITEKGETTEYLQDRFNGRVYYVPYSTRSKISNYVFKYLFVIFKSFFLFIKIKPDVIVSTGTHTAVPICYIGKLFGKKIIYIETYANITKKTLTGKILYPISNLFIVHWKCMKKLYPNAVSLEK